MPNKMVIDISHHNPDPDFMAVRADGVLGVIHKATEGTSYADPTYEKRRGQARAAGLLWGSYHFLRPGDMHRQAQWFAKSAQPAVAELVVADYEDAAVSLDDLKTFLAELAALTGLRPVIYAGNVMREKMGAAVDSGLGFYPLWWAQYGPEAKWPKQTWPTLFLWQWTDKGTVAGIGAPVDCDAFTGSADELGAAWVAPRGAPAAPAPAEPVPEAAAARGKVVTIRLPPGASLVISEAEA